LQRSRRMPPLPYARDMRLAALRAIDRLLVSLLLAGARRGWPVLRLVPASWLRPLLAPTARRLRGPLAHVMLSLSLALAATSVLLALAR
jgi:hypothetical protein